MDRILTSLQHRVRAAVAPVVKPVSSPWASRYSAGYPERAFQSGMILDLIEVQKRNLWIRTAVLAALVVFSASVTAFGAEKEGVGGEKQGPGTGPVRVARPKHVLQASRAPAGRASRRGASTRGDPHEPVGNRGKLQPRKQPSYGQTPWDRAANPSRKSVQTPAQRIQPTRQLGAARVPGVRQANLTHHTVYTQGYVRKKLEKIGVKSEPRFITDRSEIISTDRAHSVIAYPRSGPQGGPIQGTLVSSRHFNNAGVRGQMALVARPEYMQQLSRENVNETRRDHVYWHADAGFNYGHYIDASGYQWYGWYSDNQYFWTRNYDGRWWWYDSGYNRWCFYNDNYWWWQDSNHVGDLYCYDDGSYVPANSAEDPIVVTGPEGDNDLVSRSPDGTRTVKVAQGDGDAFLYDNANPPAFDPIYLASGVQSVQYSEAGNGRSLDIILKLNDGSFDMFNAQGDPYNPPANEED